MRRRVALVLTPLLVLMVPPLGAQDRLGSIDDEVGDALSDIGYIWTAPLRLGTDDLAPLGLLASSVVLTGLVDGAIQDAFRENPDHAGVKLLGPFRESRPLSRAGYTATLLTTAGALYAGGLIFDRRAVRDAGLGCAVSDLSNTLARHGIARLLGRLRPEGRRGPYVIRPLAFGEWEMRSFPSGHAANVLSCVSFWNHRFDLGAAEPALYALAAGVALARIPDEAHWASDTVFGVVFGWAVGRAVAARFRERATDEPPAEAAAGTRPSVRIGWTIRLP